MRVLPRSLTVAAFTCLLVTGCSQAKPWFSPASARTYPPKPPTCDLRVVLEAPREGYEEIGVVEYRRHYSTDAIPRDVASFRQLTSSTACAAGGDLLVPERPTQGMFERGAVYRALVPDATARPTPAGSPMVD
jgi:hypothetical protein